MGKLHRVSVALLAAMLPLVASASSVEIYGKLPMSFEANRGQTDPSVEYLARGQGYAVYLTGDEAVLSLRKHAWKMPSVLRMGLVRANRDACPDASDELPGTINYFTGTGPITGIPTYGKVRYDAVYPGIDLVYYGNQRQLEYDFIVAAGANPGQIAFRCAGAEHLEIAGDGTLLIRLADGDLRWEKPVAYQQVNGRRQEVASAFVLKGRHRVGFHLGDYDRSLPVVIDPTLAYSTYLGGNSDESVRGIAVDASNNVYVVGETASSNFPKTNAFDGTFEGASDGFLTKIRAGGSNIVFSTYINGNNGVLGTLATSVAVDTGSFVYVCGYTDVPMSLPTPNGFRNSLVGGSDGFVMKFATNGQSLLYGTYLGGTNDEVAMSIAVDNKGMIYVTGETESGNFPVKNAYRSTFAGGIMDGFVTKINPAASGNASLLYSTYLGGDDDEAGEGIAVDISSNVYVTGYTYSTNYPYSNGAYQTNLNNRPFFADAFVTKMNPSASGAVSFVSSTFLGGEGDENVFEAGCIAVDGRSNVFVAGSTSSTNLAVTADALQLIYGDGVDDGFVVRLSPGLSNLVYCSYLGGEFDDAVLGIAADASTNFYVAGYTASTNFPATSNAPQKTFGDGFYDGFVAKFASTSSVTRLVYSTFLGGTDDDKVNAIAVTTNGNAFVGGETSGNGFPFTPGANRTNSAGFFDGFVARIAPSANLVLTMTDLPDPVLVSNTLTYTIVLTNIDDLAATSVVVTDALPSLVRFISATPSQGTCTTNATGTVTCNLNTIGSGAGATITIQTLTFGPGVATNVAAATLQQLDPVLTNNTAKTITTIGSGVTLTVATPDAFESNMSTGVFTVTRSGSLQAGLLVNYSLTGSATVGVDYSSLTGSVLIAAGSAGASIRVIAIQDMTVECNETVIAALQPGVGYNIGAPNTGTVTIHDAPVHSLGVTATLPTASEIGPITGMFTIVRCSLDTNAPVTINYTLTGTASKGSDYVTNALPGSLTIPAGSSSANLIIAPIPDTLAEGDETVVITLTNAAGYSMVPSNATVIIHDKLFDAWRFANFGANANNPNVGGEQADPDGDGLANLTEYAFNLNPNASSAIGLPRPTIEGGFLTMTYRVNPAALDLTYIAEVNGALSNAWNSGSTFTFAPVLITNSGTVQTWKVSDKTPFSTAKQREIRLHITRQP